MSSIPRKSVLQPRAAPLYVAILHLHPVCGRQVWSGLRYFLGDPLLSLLIGRYLKRRISHNLMLALIPSSLRLRDCRQVCLSLLIRDQTAKSDYIC